MRKETGKGDVGEGRKAEKKRTGGWMEEWTGHDSAVTRSVSG